MLDYKLSIVNDECVVQKVYKILEFINRITAPFKNKTCTEVLFYAYVRNILEFASQIWAPYYNVHI